MSETKAAHRALCEVVPLALALVLATVWLLVFALRIAATPPKLSNEAELMYEASRIERDLPLYTDPLQGTLDDGPLPIRHYVLYGPVAPWLLSFVASPLRLIVARYLSVILWFVGIPAVALGGMPDRRVAAFVVGLSYAGLFLLARDAVHFTLTPLPVFLATVSLVRVIRHGSLDIISSLLFTAAWMIKPLVIGIALAVAVWTLFDRRTPRGERVVSILGGALSVGAGVGVLVATSQGHWFAHLRASTANGILPGHWLHFIRDYFPILGLPHLAVATFLLARAGRARNALASPRFGPRSVWAPRNATLTGWVLLVSTLWSVFAMGKRGSNAGYFMEPCAALVVAIAYGLPARDACPREWRPRTYAAPTRLILVLCPVISAAIGWPQIRSFWREDASAEWRLLHEVHDACERAAPGAAMRASLPSLELPLSGRVTLAPWQQTVLVNRGVFPLELLITDLDVPELGCLVLTRGLSGPPPPESDGVGEFVFFDVLFDVKLRRPILDRFDEFATLGGLHLFRRKGGGKVR